MTVGATANGRAPAQIAELELGEPLRDLCVSPRHDFARVLLRLRGEPLGEICVRLREGRCSAAELADAVVREHARELMTRLLRDALEGPAGPESWRPHALLRAAPPQRASRPLPSL